MLKLYCFGESGHSYKVALGLTLAGLEWQAEHVDFFNGAQRTPEYLNNVNEMGEAPVLVLEDGTKMSQSGVILDWIAAESGAFAGPSQDAEVLRWVLWDNHKLSSQAGVRRFLMNFLSEDKRPAEVIGFLGGRLTAALKVLEAHLRNREWIAGDALSAADISCCSYLFYEEPFGFNRAEWPAIDAWLARISAQPNWAHPYDLMTPAFPAKQA